MHVSKNWCDRERVKKLGTLTQSKQGLILDVMSFMFCKLRTSYLRINFAWQMWCYLCFVNNRSSLIDKEIAVPWQQGHGRPVPVNLFHLICHCHVKWTRIKVNNLFYLGSTLVLSNWLSHALPILSYKQFQRYIVI